VYLIKERKLSMLFKKNTASKYDLIIVGLGNPGKEYEKTRHNAGFIAVDKIIEKFGATNKKVKNKAEICDCKIGGSTVLIVKPQTYMNLSGEAVGPLSKYFKVGAENVFVIFDDISLPVGNIRLRKKGSAGGHNGIKSLIAHLGTENFPRLKIGVGAKPHPDADLKNHVLGGIPKEEIPNYEKALDNTVSAIEEMLKNGIDSAMNKFNS
jgi:PTH1 family peptidyl-tRNA hydrolase